VDAVVNGYLSLTLFYSDGDVVIIIIIIIISSSSSSSSSSSFVVDAASG